MAQFGKQFLMMYLSIGTSWWVVTLIAWTTGRLVGHRLDGRKIETESPSPREARTAVFHTFTRSIAGLALANAIITLAFPDRALPPLTPLRFTLELLGYIAGFDLSF